MELGVKILREKLTKAIEFKKEQNIRYDTKLDYISFALTERQFYFVKKCFEIKETYNGYFLFKFDNYNVKAHFNTRLNCYELLFLGLDYIEDFDERQEYIEKIYNF